MNVAKYFFFFNSSTCNLRKLFFLCHFNLEGMLVNWIKVSDLCGLCSGSSNVFLGSTVRQNCWGTLVLEHSKGQIEETGGFQE